jgi:iron complex outermembrane receptor protein
MHDGIRSALTRAVLGFMFLSCAAHAGGQPVKFNLPSQSLAQSLRALASQTQTNILFDQALVRGLTARALDAELSLDQAMDRLLAGTGLTYRKTDEKTVVIAPARGTVVPPASRDTSTSASASRVAALNSSTESVGRRSGIGEVESKDRDSPHLEEIVITARRREENINSVPVAVTALTSLDLRAKNIQTAEDLQNYVPSLNVSSSVTRDDYTFSLRGMGPTGGSGPGAVLAGGGTGVVTYFADVPTSGAGPGLFYDLESVQVAAGPQGTLFGKNTTGGAVLFVPKKPINDFEGSIEFGLGNYNMKTATAMVNVPLVDNTVLLRIAGQFLDRDGFTIDRGPFFAGKDYDNRDYWALRASLLLRPFDNLENTTIFSALHSEGNGDGFVLTAADPAGAFGSLLSPILADQQVSGIRSTSLSANEIDRRYNYGIINTTRWSISEQWQFKNIFSYQVQKWRNSEDVDGTSLVLDDLVPVGQGWHTQVGTYTEEPQIQGAALDDHLKITAGAYYEDGHNLAPQPYQVQVALGNFLINQIDQTNSERSRGLYAQTTYDLGGIYSSLNGLKLTTGYRYTWDNYSYGIASFSPSNGNACLTSSGTYPDSDCAFSASGQSGGSSWTLGLDYQLPAALVYVRSGRGYVPGGFNPSFGFTSGGVDTPQFRFAPESVIDVELGVKSEFEIAGAPTQVTADIFHSDYTDIQRYVSEVLPGGIASNFTANASEAEIEGFEFQGSVAPVSGLTLTATYSYNHGKYTKVDPAAAPSLVGVPFAYLPQNKASVGATYKLPLAQTLGEYSLGLFYSYQSRFFDAPSVQPFDYIEGYGLLNARIDWNHVFQTSLDASFFVTNATDKIYRVGQYNDLVANGYITSFYGEPRMWGVQLRYRFGRTTSGPGDEP